MRFQTLSIALAATVVSVAAQAQRVSLPAGSVIIVRTTTPLQSATAQSGQTFETTVDESIGVDDYTVIPSGSRIRGVISTARRASRQQSGVVEVTFDQLMLADGTTLPIRGKLTSTDSAERRQIKANPSGKVVLVGGQGGIGAAIAAAGSNNRSNNFLSALGNLLAEGRDVDVPAGTPLAVELEASVMLRGGRRARGTDANTIFTAPERVRAAQQALAQRNYYRGSANGRVDDATRRALFQFQVDQRIAATGNLDGRTAQALGMNLSGGLAGGTLSSDAASSVRRDAQSLASRYRSELRISSSGRLDPSRTYGQGDLDLLFALSALQDNAALYEQIVRGGGSVDGSVLAGRALMAAARRVETAAQNARVSRQVQDAWASLRSQLAALE
jgi:peptidoglycan hydrolase-like protein with peptidoglycan-binding domain